MAFEVVKKNLEARGFAVTVCETAAEAAEYLNKAIDDKTVGIGGSLTIKELDIHNKLVLHNEVYWHWLGGQTDRKLAAGADVYLQNHAGNSSYAVAFTENGKKFWMVHSGYDALPSCISGVSLTVERPDHKGCCGE